MQSPVVYITTLIVTTVMFCNPIMTQQENLLTLLNGLLSKQCKKVSVALCFALMR